MGTLLLAAALSAAAPQAYVPSSGSVDDARPAMFVVRDADTIVYIFGTFHALDGQSEWFKDRVKSAFDGSGELVLETVVPDEASKVPAPGRLTPTTSTGAFLATTRMVISAGRAKGMQVGKGADTTLRTAAESGGKFVLGLETPELQMNMYSRMSPPSQLSVTAQRQPAAAAAVPGPTAELSNVMAELQAAWKRGDQRIFVQMLGQLERTSPDTYRIMFTERNARWADWVSARLRTPGTVFVAVGAGHLAGKDSLLVRLAELGIRSSRLN